MPTSGDNYYLGIDLGTTYTGAGILRHGRPEVVTLGDRSPVIPSVLYFKEDGEVLTGEPANRRGLMDPSRVARQFKRRVGDSTPMVVGQTPYSAETLLAKLLRFVYNEVADRQGSAPSAIMATHPANWGSYKIDVLNQAVRMADIGPVETTSEPVAAAVHYASTARMEPGQAVAVYDLGGGTFDAAVVRKTTATGVGSPVGAAGPGFELLGDAEGIDRLGGIDLDEAVFQHVMRWCESAVAELDPDDQATLQALVRVRQECVAAKEALSADTDVAIPVVLPNLQTEVRLTRAEFEAMIRPVLQQTVEALRRAVRSAGVDVTELAAVLLVGGSSQIPLVAELVGADLGRPIAVDQHPKHTVALGAAIAAGHSSGAEVPAPAAAPAPAVQVASPVGSVSENGSVGSMFTDQTHTHAEGPTTTPTSTTPTPAAVAPLVSLVDAGPSTMASTSSSPTATFSPDTETSPAAPTSDRGGTDVDRTQVMPYHDPGFADPIQPPNAPSTGGRSGRPLVLLVAAVVALVALGGVAWAMLGDDPGSDNAAQTDTGNETDNDGTVADEAVTTSVTDTTATTEADAPETSDTTVSSETSVTAETTTTSQNTTTVVDGLAASIADITVEGGQYAVAYNTNFSPLISSDPATSHLHFFFDTVPVSEAGVPGGGPWILYDGPSPFTGYGPGDRPAGANQMCVTAASHAHEVVDPSLYDCAALPDS